MFCERRYLISRVICFAILSLFLGACGDCGDSRLVTGKKQNNGRVSTGGGDGVGADGLGDDIRPGDGTSHEPGAQFCGDGVCLGIEDSQNCPEDCARSEACGDGVCAPASGDDCRSCPEDCGVCQVQCGDGICWGTESCTTCVDDCGECADTCGDGVCQPDENSQNCPYDCGFPTTACGDNVCNGTEDCESCAQDCGECSPTCQPGQCGAGENCQNCPSGCGPCTGCGDRVCGASESCESCEPDCGICLSPADGCGDGECKGIESPQNCPIDCGSPGPACGDGVCNGTEDAVSCPLDCEAADPATCPDGQCFGETCQDCPQDCGSCMPRCGDGICQPDEAPCACVADCGECSAGTSCGDGACSPGETSDICSTDCPDSPGCLIDVGLPECQPNAVCTGTADNTGGDTCDGILEAWRSTADNVGYYPYKVRDGISDVDVISGLGSGLGDPDMLLGKLSAGDYFAVQSERNPSCADNPALREYTNAVGLVFGYSPSLGVYGWIEPSQFTFAGYEVANEVCLDGLRTQKKPSFQVRQNPYDNCRAMPCSTVEKLPDGSLRPHYNDCASANRIEDAKYDCGGAPVSPAEIHDVKVLTTLFYSQEGNAHRFIYPGDKVKVLYKGANAAWGFVEVTRTSEAPLTEVGDRGWMLLSRTCLEGKSCAVCIDNDMDGRGENCELGADCDDNDPTVYEGAIEICNNKDDNCNGEVDEGAGCATQCIQDAHEPDNDSLSGNNLTTTGVYGDMNSCASCPRFDRDWFKLGSPTQPFTIELTHPTGLNPEGQPYADLDIELFCDDKFCDSIRGTAGTTSKTFDGSCASAGEGAEIAGCTSQMNWALAVYPRCSGGSPIMGTPYQIRRK